MTGGPEKFFKTAPQRSLAENTVRTALQVAMMWGLFLFLLPWGIIALQERLGIPLVLTGNWKPVAAAVFVVAGATGLSCGWSFVRWGGGTPIPCDQTTRLTIVGLYRYVRNPMAVLGILQGLMVALYFGSWPVALYALCGAFVWEFVAKPPEERDLARRFGEEYEAYRREVKCWVPQLRPYKRVAYDAKPRSLDVG